MWARGFKNHGIVVGGVYANGTRGAVRLRNMVVRDTCQSGLRLVDVEPNGTEISFSNVTFADTAAEPTGWEGKRNAPLLFLERSTPLIGGVTFDACEVRDALKRPFVLAEPNTTLVEHVRGSFRVFNPFPVGCTAGIAQRKDVNLAVSCNAR